jgi:hypothetical protein
MLRCNMNAQSFPSTLQLGLDDLLADLRYSRRQGDVGRLALLAYCEVRRWARQANEPAIASHSATMVTDGPHASREAFLGEIDQLIDELVAAHVRLLEAESRAAAEASAGQAAVPTGALPAPRAHPVSGPNGPGAAPGP